MSSQLLGRTIKLGQAAATTSEVSGLSSDDPCPSLLEVCVPCATKLSRYVGGLSLSPHH